VLSGDPAHDVLRGDSVDGSEMIDHSELHYFNEKKRCGETLDTDTFRGLCWQHWIRRILCLLWKILDTVGL